MSKVVTGICRFSYVNLDKPRAPKIGAEPKYSIMLLIPKSDTATVDAIKAAQKAAAEKTWGNKVPKVIAYTLRDGDGVRPSDGEPYNAECKGHWVMNVASKTRPSVVGPDLQPVIEPGEWGSGDYGRVSINAYAYDNSGNRGVSFGLNHVQFVRKGERLDGRSSATDDFSMVADPALS